MHRELLIKRFVSLIHNSHSNTGYFSNLYHTGHWTVDPVMGPGRPVVSDEQVGQLPHSSYGGRDRREAELGSNAQSRHDSCSFPRLVL